MKRNTSTATACVAAVLLAIAVGVGVGAQDFNTQERTFLTFSSAIELPGLTLPAGTYTFRLADTTNRNVVQVLSEDEMQTHGQFLFIPTERLEATGDTVITFRETREGSTPAVQYWYYPGERIGKEFIYPKDQAMRIAQRTGSGVRTEDGRVDASGVIAEEPGASASAGQATSPATPVPAAERAAANPAEGGQGSTATRDATSSQVATADQTTDSTPAERQDAADRDRTETPATPTAAGQQAENAVAQPAAAVQDPIPVPGGNSLPTRRADDSASARQAESNATGTSGTGSTAVATRQTSDSTTREPESVEARRELPRTASPLPLVTLLGALSLAGGLVLRRARH